MEPITFITAFYLSRVCLKWLLSSALFEYHGIEKKYRCLFHVDFVVASLVVKDFLVIYREYGLSSS